MDAMSLKTVNVTYVGNKPTKRDTVTQSAYLWAGYGDTHEVPYSIASQLLRHADVWVLESEFKAKFPEELPEQKPEPASEGFVIGASDDDFDSDDEGEGEGEGGEESQGDEQDADVGAIKNAILSLEQGNPEHFSQKGAPKINAVREAAGDTTITADQVRDVWATLGA